MVVLILVEVHRGSRQLYEYTRSRALNRGVTLCADIAPDLVQTPCIRKQLTYNVSPRVFEQLPTLLVAEQLQYGLLHYSNTTAELYFTGELSYHSVLHELSIRV